MSLATGCADFRRLGRISRRELLSIGPALGISLATVLQAREQSAAEQRLTPRARSVILLYLHGGAPQHETWDPKPQAPAEVRGQFGTIASSLPGLSVGELLPECAKIADRLAVIRSLTHDNANHVQASLTAMTGHSHPPEAQSRGDFPPSPSDFPAYGAVIDYFLGFATVGAVTLEIRDEAGQVVRRYSSADPAPAID